MGTAGQWASDFLARMGQTDPTPEMLQIVSAWVACEGTKARYNPLATTYDLPPNSNFNTVGVKNFESREQGIEASKRTLDGDFYGYARVRAAITANDADDLRWTLIDPLFPWGTGSVCLLREMENEAVVNFRLKSEETTDSTDPPRSDWLPPVQDDFRNVFDIENPFRLEWLDTETLNRVLYGIVGGLLIAMAGSLFVRRFIPTEQVLRTVVDAAVPG